jgi:hypothetical protein
MVFFEGKKWKKGRGWESEEGKVGCCTWSKYIIYTSCYVQPMIVDNILIEKKQFFLKQTHTNEQQLGHILLVVACRSSSSSRHHFLQSGFNSLSSQPWGPTYSSLLYDNMSRLICRVLTTTTKPHTVWWAGISESANFLKSMQIFCDCV